MIFEQIRRQRPNPNYFPKEAWLVLFLVAFLIGNSLFRWWTRAGYAASVRWWHQWAWVVVLSAILLASAGAWMFARWLSRRKKPEASIPFGRQAGFPWSPFFLQIPTLNMHTLVIAPTGRGKTSTVLLPLGIEHLKAGHGLFALEPKPGDLLMGLKQWAEHLDRPFTYWNPMLTGCPVFNPLHGTRIEAANRIAFAISKIHANRNSSAGADFYQGVGRNILRHTIYALKSVLGADAHLGHVRDFIQNATFREKINKACTDRDALSYFTNQFNQWSAQDQQRNSAGILDTLNALLAHDQVKAALCGPNQVDLDAIYQEAGVLLVGLVTGELADLAPVIGGLWWYSNQLAAFKRTSRTFFANLVDEYPDFCGEGDAKFFTQIRSYRVGITVVVQSKTQFSYVGGPDFAELLADQCATKIILPGLGPKDALWAADVCGRRYDLQCGWDGKGDTTSQAVIDDYRLDPTSITEMPFKRAIVRTVIKNRVHPPLYLRTTFAASPPSNRPGQRKRTNAAAVP